MTQATPATWLTRALRTICAFIDRIVYFLIAFVYQLFIQVANATLLTGSTVRTLTARVQLIFGLLLIFRLAVSVINGIINPDTFTDREKGFSEVIKRTIIVLIMFTLIVPVNISNPNSHYQKNIANHGLLFGTLYEIQNSVLSRNVMFRLVFGGDESNDSDLNNMSSLSGQANAMAGSIYKSFMSINLVDESKGEDDPSNWVCEDEITDSEINYYTKADASVSEVVSLTEEWCQPEEDKKFSNIFKPKSLEKGMFKFAFQPLISTVCGVFVLIMFISFTLDIAIRAIKLAILRLIAPIPIGSYIDPKSQRDGAFASWIRITISTYIDLFIRLLIVYFAIFLVQEISTKGLVIEKVSDNIILNSLTNVVMFIAIFFFAKQAPKFISDAVGLKGMGLSNVGLSGMFGGIGTLVGGGGLAKAFSNSMQAMSDANASAAEGKGYSPMSNAYAGFRDKTLQQITGDKNRRGGILGRLDHATDKALAARRGLTESSIKKAKGNAAAAQLRSDEADRAFDSNLKALQNTGVTDMNFANANSENAYAKLQKNKAAIKASTERLSTLAPNSQEYNAELQNIHNLDRANKNFERAIATNQRFTSDDQLEQFIKTRESYDSKLKANQEATDYAKNASDMKEAYGYMVGKDVPYGVGSKGATPEINDGRDSKRGSGGNIFSGAGVNTGGGVGGSPTAGGVFGSPSNGPSGGHPPGGPPGAP